MSRTIKTVGIYKITNKINNKCYIGSSIYSIETRFNRHKSDLNRNIHPNKHLQASWNKYGRDTFKFEIIEICEKDKCIIREQFYIDTIKPQYNKAPKAGNSSGRIVTKETKEKMSISGKGKHFLDNIGNSYKKGCKLSEETKKLISLGNSIKIKDENDNIFNSMTEASLKTNTCIKSIRNSINENRFLKTGKRFFEIEEII